MKVRQLGSTDASVEVRQHLTTFIINDTIAIDAGCLGLSAPVSMQGQIKHVLISHSHLDHIATLPLFLDNVFQPNNDCPTIYASRDVWYALKTDVMNERLWPDLSRIGSEEFRFFREQELVSEVPIQVDGLTITPVGVDHTVPTQGFLIEDSRSAIVIASDTCPTQRLWELANRSGFREKLRLVFLECSFPDNYEWLAIKSKHLCSRLFALELAKLSPGAPFETVAVHLKAMMDERIRSELMSLGLPQLTIGSQDQTWVV